jgi:hypothetical protein
LRRLAVCVDEKCRDFEEGAAALLADKCLSNLAERNAGIRSSGTVCIADPLEPVIRASHSCIRLDPDQEGKRKKQNVGCRTSRKAGCLTGSGSKSVMTRLPLTSGSKTESLNLNVGYLQALVGGLQSDTQNQPILSNHK